MLRRSAMLLVAGFVLLAPAFLAGCKKSEGSDTPDLFGPPPQVSAVTITKERKHFDCSSSVDLCCVDPPFCSCCCIPDQVQSKVSDIDLVTITADVSDPDGISDLLVVLARFLDPPQEGTPPGTTLNQISLEMFDVGGAVLGTVQVGGTGIPIFSGDVAPNDGTYTRRFYIHTNTGINTQCVETTDFQTIQGTYSTFGTIANYSTSSTRNFLFSAQAIDRAGNIAESTGTTLAIEESSDVESFIPRACGAPSGNGGCLPGP